MRLTSHNARTGKDGAFNPKHNDRDFDLANATHIDGKKTKENRTRILCQDDDTLTFEEAEKKFYEEFFQKSLNTRNERYLAQRHSERVKTMDDYRNDKRTCPEEVIYQIGNKGKSIEPEKLWSIIIKQLKWEGKQFPQIQFLDIALHVDESTPHIHVRKVWIAESKNGYVVSQRQALKQMGVKAPDPDKDIDRFNNPKITYTRMCRNHLLQLCKEHGIDIEEEPKKTSEVGLSLLEYKAQQERNNVKDAQTEMDALRQEKGLIDQINPQKNDFKKGFGGKYILTDEELDGFLTKQQYVEKVPELILSNKQKDEKLKNLQEQLDATYDQLVEKVNENIEKERELKKLRKRERERSQALQAEHKERHREVEW